MSYNEQIKMLLTRVLNNSLSNEPLPGMTEEQYFALIEDCERNGYISTYMKQIVYRYMDGGDIADGITLTKSGHDFLEGNDADTSSPTIGQQFNIGTASNSNFGNYGTVTNNFGITIEDLFKFIEEKIEPNDQEEAKEVLEVVQKTEELKPGVLKRFDNLLQKYPNFSSSIGTLIMTLLTSATNGVAQ